ncbi:MAG: type II toxin-antitoxin system RelE/ParE family toxin [Bdellovibrio sp.]|nr:type II toxin-antitoxin system RelE/ParE family toxin [Bdellovibrio sp.]
MKVYFTRKAEKGLEKIFSHVVKNFSFEQAQIVRNELVASILKLGDFPELGNKLAGQSDKRVLFVSGNAIVYEIVLVKDPYIIIRNIKPRKTA